MSKPYGDEDALVQFYEPKAVVLFTVKPDSWPDAPTPIPVAFRVRLPSAQCRVKISLNWELPAGTLDRDLLANTCGLWLAAADDAIGGASSSDVLNGNVEGSSSALTPFPQPGLLGYSREFVSSADWIVGAVSVGPPGSGEGVFPGASLVLKTSYQADGVVLPCAAWRRIRSLAKADKA